ncbi:N-acetylaspartylglutamate synthase A isoform 2-T3 [Anomaloglossus baeobatrachus]|uniref:N-acetylaspartylglutamate synthase A isoform X2 n=1 Tax=Anomaloglossus baeobatrachus TaxID=238106 RepID=UPI003F501C21
MEFLYQTLSPMGCPPKKVQSVLHSNGVASRSATGVVKPDRSSNTIINAKDRIKNCVASITHDVNGGHDEFAKMIDAAEPLGYPVVVKNTRGHQGKAVFLARDKHHLLDISHLVRHDAPYLFQKYVKESHGKDIRVVIVGGRVVGSMLRSSTDGRMQSNCCLGGVGSTFPLSEQGKLLAMKVSNLLGMDICGIDLLLKDNGSFVVCEANANVGFTEFDQACKLDLGAIIADYAISLIPSRPSEEMSLLSAESSPQEINETKALASASNHKTSDGSRCSNSVSDVKEIRDSINAPKPCSPLQIDSICNDVTE